MPIRRLGHVPALDGLRGAAVVLVMTYHAMTTLVPRSPTLDPRVVPGGFLGVDLFFVLSGYLITALLLRARAERGNVPFLLFYRGRLLRLLPALLVLLGVSYAYAALTDLDLGLQRSSIQAALLYYFNWKLVRDFIVAPGLGHLWSLSIEEQFYLVWPAVLAGLVALRRWRWVAPAILAAAVVGVLVHRRILWDGGTMALDLYWRTDTRIDSLLVGALLAFLWAYRLTPRRGLVPLGWLGILVLGYGVARLPVGEGVYYRGGFTVVALACAAIILATLETDWPVNHVLRWSPLRTVGRVSYGLYLWHLFIFEVVARYGDDWSAAARLVVGVGGTALCAAGSWWLVERQALAFKTRLELRAVGRARAPATS